MVPRLQEGEPRWPNRVSIPAQRGEEAGQVYTTQNEVREAD